MKCWIFDRAPNCCAAPIFPEVCWGPRSRVAPYQNLHTCKECTASVSLKGKNSLLFWQMFQLPSDTDGPWHCLESRKKTTFLICLHCAAANSNIHGFLDWLIGFWDIHEHKPSDKISPLMKHNSSTSWMNVWLPCYIGAQLTKCWVKCIFKNVMAQWS